MQLTERMLLTLMEEHLYVSSEEIKEEAKESRNYQEVEARLEAKYAPWI